MSERAIADPTEHGWVDAGNGKWVWGVEGGGGGSIQDGDTEGQITTWDGTEWTPEGAVVVDNGNVGIGTDTPASVVTSASNALVVSADGNNSASASFQTDSAQWEIGSFENAGGIFGVFNNATTSFPLTIDADGNVGVGESPSTYDSRANHLVAGDSGDAGITIFSGASNTSRLQFTPSGDTGLNRGLIGYDNANDKMTLATAGTDRIQIDADGNVNITGKLFVNGQEVTAGGGAVDAYTKAESDGKYVPKSGNTTISGTLTATDFVTS